MRFWRSDGWNQFHWATVPILAMLLSSGGSMGESASLLFQRLEDTGIPWLMTPFCTTLTPCFFI